MNRPRIHLIAPAGSCKPFIDSVADGSVDMFLSNIQRVVGDAYEIAADKRILLADEDEDHGGRNDDDARVSDIQNALADDSVACVLAVRGGAWLTRIIPDIDFTVLDRRTTRVAIIGFSEMTPLINIVAAHENGVGIYDMSPAFLTYGLRRYATLQARAKATAEAVVGTPETPTSKLRHEGQSPDEWMHSRLQPEFDAFIKDVAAMIEGRGSTRSIAAKLVHGTLPEESSAVFIGGNLCLFTVFLGTPYEAYISPDERWIVLEDINDKPERIDRFLARMKLAGYFERCAGVLLGDFHNGDKTHTDAVVELMPYHLPKDRDVPVLVSEDVGHIWPVSPLPLCLPSVLQQRTDKTFSISWSRELVQVRKPIAARM